MVRSMGWLRRSQRSEEAEPATAGAFDALAADEPAPSQPPTPLRLVTDPPVPEPTGSNDDLLLACVTSDLSASDSGVEFVYRSLDRIQRRAEADDLLVILDDGPLGRQAFRAGRRPIESDWARELVRSGAPGVHATPVAVEDQVSSSVAQLCGLALRLDVARHDSLHDGLTGLLNRRAFDEVLTTSCSQAQRYGWSFALVLLDLDGFKTVNDRFGHATGDATLRTVGAELRHRLRAGDAAARIGGDEFALVLPNVGSGLVGDLTDRIAAALSMAMPDANLSISMGHALAPEDGLTAEDLFAEADLRLYESKRR